MKCKVRILMMCCLWLTASVAMAQSGKEWLADGNAKYAEGHFQEAAELYEKAATAGVLEAQCNIGTMYYQGEGVDKDFSTAAMWLKRAARGRYAKAEYYLSLCYMNGQGVPVSYDKALMYMKAAALRGYREAQIRLSELYAKGVMVETDMEESNRWLAMSRGEDVEMAPEVERAVKPVLKEQNTAAAPSAPATPVASTPSSPVASLPKTPDASAPSAPAVTPSATPKAETPVVAQQPVQQDVKATSEPAKAEVTPAATPASTPPLLAEQTADGGEKAVDDDAARQNILSLLKQDSLFAGLTDPKAEARKKAEAEAAARAQLSEDDPANNGAPIIRILYPEDQAYFHTDVVKLKYQLLAQGLEPVTKITVMVDGVRQPESRAVKQANMIDVDVPNRDCTVMLFAQNEKGNSVPATIRLIRENVTQVDLPRLFAVSVGVGDYEGDEKLPSLKMTTKDAQDFATAVMSKKGQPFSDVQVKVLCDQEARRSDIFEAMEWMAQEARPNDLCMFFFAGHGYRDEKDRFYFMPYGGSTNRLYECFSANDFKTAADEINSKFVIFADACYSAGLLEGSRSAAAQHFVEQLRRSKNGMLLYASSSGDTKSKEDPTWGNGAFTKALVEAFNGAARHEGDEGLSTRALDSYLYDAVRKTTGFKQTPVFMNPSGIEHFNIFTYEKK